MRKKPYRYKYLVLNKNKKLNIFFTLTWDKPNRVLIFCDDGY